MIKAIGAKGKIKDVDSFLKQIDNFSQSHHIIIQVFDADMVYGKKHLVSAVEHAIRAFKQKTNTSDSLPMEILLYASGERQLKQAIPKLGIKKDKTNIAMVFVNNIEVVKDAYGKLSEKLINKLLMSLSIVRDDSVIEGDVGTLGKFGLIEDEIATVTKAKYENLILEKVAMVDIIK
ncbi:MAG: KEOPS complex subunit Cgi121 [Petrotogales bacterium]